VLSDIYFWQKDLSVALRVSSVNPTSYISLFSGIGGLESPDNVPLACCEMDVECQKELRNRYPSAEIHDLVEDFKPPRTDVVVGGWPCQDLSVAGNRKGLDGNRSGLFFELVRVARESGAHSIIGENVPNLIRSRGGADFDSVINTLSEAGYPNISWRMLNAREFGLPHQRLRLFIIASQFKEIATSLHRDVAEFPSSEPEFDQVEYCNGFYWTAGLQSICLSEGFTPTLKVGSSLAIPSPPAVHFDSTVRKLTSDECLRLQGFDPLEFYATKPKDVHRMAGNAVAVPVGNFVFDSVKSECIGIEELTMQRGFSFGRFPNHGLLLDREYWSVEHKTGTLAVNLAEFIDTSNRLPISRRAANGLLARLGKSGKPCPEPLMNALSSAAELQVNE